jgi:hypothetical protein
MKNKFFESLKQRMESDKSIQLTRGQCAAYRLWYWHDRDDFVSDELVMDDHLWDSEVADFIDMLREAGIKSFIVTCHSSGLMDNIHGYVDNGCKLAGLCKVQKDGWRSEEVKGIRFEL